jgi:uncharacterized membrane protein YedE/YeeE
VDKLDPIGKMSTFARGRRQSWFGGFLGFVRLPLAVRYLWPTRTDIDRRLVAGSILFGIGWGLVGLCPGPAVVNLAGQA